MIGFKKIMLVCAACLAWGVSSAQQINDTVYAHEVEVGETLYSMARKYGVTVEEIQSVNPGMGTTILAGSVITLPKKAGNSIARLKANTAPLPKCKQQYLVEKKETMYSISKKFNITVDEFMAANPKLQKEKLKKGEFVCIPFPKDTIDLHKKKVETVVGKAKAEEEKYSTIKLAVVLPFGLDNEKPTAENRKMLEYYEGVLLAVDSMKNRGVSVDVYAYDESSDSVISSWGLIQRNPMLKYVNIIIGPMRQNYIPGFAQFADNNGINLVVPFSSKKDLPFGHKNLYQVNSNIEFSKVADAFVSTYSSENIVFVDMTADKDEADFCSKLKTVLDSKGISNHTITFENIDGIDKMLQQGKKNIIIPSSHTSNAFEILCYKLNTMDLSAYSLNFFGYPEWQTLGSKNKANLHKYNSTFYASFYYNPSDQRTKYCEAKFKDWYGTSLLNSYPKFGLLGFDTAFFFIHGLSTYGSKFAENIASVKYDAYQNPMSFKRFNETGGFCNSSVTFVNCGRNMSISTKVY